jgi:hypothetical protein
MLFIFITSVYSQWPTTPSESLLILPPGDNHRMISDNAGGLFLGWDANYNLRAQWIDKNGKKLWGEYGISVCDAPWPQHIYPGAGDVALLSNGNLGMVWTDSRRGFPMWKDVYVQTINQNGVAQWDSNGVPAVVTEKDDSRPSLIPDADGGMFVFCLGLGEDPLESKDNLYIQHFSATGERLWGETGILLKQVYRGDWEQYTVYNNLAASEMMLLFSIIIHESEKKLELNMINSDGVSIWGTGGKIIFEGPYCDCLHVLKNDNQDFLLVYRKLGIGERQVFMRKILIEDESLSIDEEIPISPFYTGQEDVWIYAAVSDFSKGAYIIWKYWDENGHEYSCQHSDSTGTRLWEIKGAIEMISDGAGGVIVFRQETVNDTTWSYLQRVNYDGEMVWEVPFTDRPNIEWPKLAGDQKGGVYLVFQYQGQIHLQWIDKDGRIGGISRVPENQSVHPGTITLEQNYPNPFNSQTVISYELSNHVPQQTTLKIFNALGKEVQLLTNEIQTRGKYQLVWDTQNRANQPLPSGVYFCHLTSGCYHAMKKLILIR